MTGFSKIENNIIEEMARRKFNGTQYRILFSLWRNTYGWQRDHHDLSLNFFSEATGIERSRVKKDLKKLIEAKVITVIEEASFNKTRVIAFNKNFDEWQIDSCVPNRPQGANPTTGDESDSTTGGEMDHTGGGESAPQQRKNKEISKEKMIDQMDKPNPFTEYEKHFGQLPLGKFMNQINDWIDDSQFKEPEAIICETIKRVKLQTPKNPQSYINSALSNLHNLGLFTLAAVQEYNSNFDNQTKKQWKNKKSVHDLPKKRPDHWSEPEPLTKDEFRRMKELEAELPY